MARWKMSLPYVSKSSAASGFNSLTISLISPVWEYIDCTEVFVQSRSRYFINFYQIKSSSIDVLTCLPRFLLSFKSRYFSCSQLPFSAAIKDDSFEPILSSFLQCDCVSIVVTVSGTTKPPVKSLERASGRLFSVNVSLINKSPSTEEAIFVLQTRNENGIIATPKNEKVWSRPARSITSRDVGRRVQDGI